MKEKFKEWIKRYLPANLICTAATLLFSWIVLLLTKDKIAAAFAGSIGGTIIYYVFLAARDIYESRKTHKFEKKKYGFISFLKNIRNLIVEFIPGEIIDTLVIRPYFLYIFPILLNNFAIGIIVGKYASDVIFYSITIIAYEWRKKHLKD